MRLRGRAAGWGPGRPGVAWMLAGLAGLAVLSGPGRANLPARAGQATGAAQAVGQVGAITVTVSSLHPGGATTLTGNLRLATSGPASDQLDAALADGDAAVGVYHRQVSVGEISDLASCDGDLPSPVTVSQWLHYGPLLVPGRAYGPSPPATATLTIGTGGVPAPRSVAITFYFAHAGQLTLAVPVRPA